MSDNQQDAGPDAARDARQQRLPLQWDPAVPGGPASSGRPAPSAQEPAADAPARESGAGNPVLPPDDISTGDEAVAAGGQTLLPGVAAESEVSATGPVPASVGDGGQPVARLDALPASLGQTLMEARGARNLSVALQRGQGSPSAALRRSANRSTRKSRPRFTPVKCSSAALAPVTALTMA